MSSLTLRSGSASSGSQGGSFSGPTSQPPPCTDPLPEEEQKRLKHLKRVIEETRDVANPRFVVLCNILQPWNWVFVFLRSYERLRQGLHRLYPAAAQVFADRRVQPKPRLVVMDDFTVRPEVQARLKSRMLALLGPLLQWMSEEDMEGEDEEVPVLLTACDVTQLCQRVVLSPQASLADLNDQDLQRLLLARDRLYEIQRSLKPRLLVLVNWQQPTQWVFVLCRTYAKLLAGIGDTFQDRPLYIWKPRHIPSLTDASVTDYCYSSSCPHRGKPLEGVKFCPNCQVAKYCGVECQQAHWLAVHCRFCAKLSEGQQQVKNRYMGPTAAAALRQSRNYSS